MARRRKKKDVPMVELNLTAMVDVAFQLLIFFIISSHPVDVITQLNASSGGSGEGPDGEEPGVQIQIRADGVSVQDMPISSESQLDDKLSSLARNKSERITIMASLGSQHKQLVDVLDKCAKVSLTNLTISSTE